MKKNYAQTELLKKIWNVVGMFAFTFAILGWYGSTGQSIDLPIFGELKQIEIVIFGIPALFTTTVIQAFTLKSYRLLRRDTPESPPLPDSDAIPSYGNQLGWVRIGLMLAYLIIPAATQTHFLVKVHKATLVNKHTQDEFDGAEIYSDHKDKFNSRLWRWRDWHDTTKLISAVPRYQPIFYNILVASGWALALTAIFAVVRDRREHSKMVTSDPQKEIGLEELNSTLNLILEQLKTAEEAPSLTRTEQAATTEEWKSESQEKPKPESEGRSQ